MARSGSDWDDGMTDRELIDVAEGPTVESKSDAERMDLQHELCDRLQMEYTDPAGGSLYTPPPRTR